MPHGTPDWGLVGPRTTVYGLDDLGEHAVRLGSPHLWDRRGDVVWQSIFAEGLEGAQPRVGSANAAVALFTEFARQGAYCVKLTCSTEDADWAEIRKSLPFPVASRTGLEFSVSYTGAGRGRWYAEAYGRDVAEAFVARVELGIDGNLYYWDQTGTLRLFASTEPLSGGTQVDNTLKFVVDVTTFQYVRAIMGNDLFDMTGLECEHGLAGGSQYFRARFGLWQAILADTVGYLDSVIVTQNEP